MVDCRSDRPPGFVLLATYLRATRGLLDDVEQRDLEARLVANPEAGARVAGTGGVRKLRVAVRGQGKRGGARVIYYYRAAIGRIYLITAYAKNVRTDLSMADKQELRRLTAALDAEEA